jgi:hypothetical protein
LVYIIQIPNHTNVNVDLLIFILLCQYFNLPIPINKKKWQQVFAAWRSRWFKSNRPWPLAFKNNLMISKKFTSRKSEKRKFAILIFKLPCCCFFFRLLKRNQIIDSGENRTVYRSCSNNCHMHTKYFILYSIIFPWTHRNVK